MVSIIIPVFNRNSILLETIASVLRQTFVNFELIIIDDGSSHNIQELVEKNFQDKRLQFFRFEKNQGVHIARNKGLELSIGDFIFFLDSDDQIYPQAIEVAINYFQLHEDFGVFSAPYLTNSGELTSFAFAEAREIKYEELLCGCHRAKYKNGLAVIRKKIIGDIRFVEQNLDFIFYRKISKKTKFYFFNQPLGVYNITKNLQDKNNDLNITYKRKIPNIKLSISRAKALDNFLQEFSADLLKFCPKKYSSYAYGAAVGLLLNKQKKQAIKYAFKAFQNDYKRLKFFLFFIFSMLPFSGSLLKFLFKLKFFIFYRV